MKARWIASIPLLLLVGAAPALAQDVECHANKDFAIAVKSYADEAGAQFAVTALAGKPKPAKCAFDTKRADFVIGKPGDPLWFGEQTGRFLILTRSTGPQGDLVIYDLKARKPVLDVPSDDYSVSGTRVTFWQRVAEGTRKNCTTYAQNQANGLGSMISAEKVFDTASGTTKDTGKTRCDATQ